MAQEELTHKCLELLEKLKVLAEETKTSEDGELSAVVVVVQRLEQVFADISSVQSSLEAWKMFGEGENLYGEWISWAVKHYQEGLVGGMMSTPDLNRRKDALKSLIGLAYNNRGFMKYLQVDFEGAIQDYTMALKYNSDLSCAYYNRGVVTYRLAFFKQAIEDMEVAVKMDPMSAEFREGLERTKEAFGAATSYELDVNSIGLPKD